MMAVRGATKLFRESFPFRFALIAIVRCTLQVVSLRDSPRYEALSYVWGDPNAKKAIVVDGHAVQVTVNLENALRRLRPDQAPVRQLWADAICIDQDNEREKETQLPLMSKIYAEASSVLIWLGQETPHAKALFSRANTPHSFLWLAQDWIGYGVAFLTRRFPRERCEELIDAQLGVDEIFSLPYWTRVRTFQEYWLARDDPIIICGPHQCTAGALDPLKERASGPTKNESTMVSTRSRFRA